MAFHGEVLDACGVIDIDCASVTVVAVSGAGPNVCGHLLLHTGPSRGGYYFHIAVLHGQPHYMSESGYRRYLSEAKKTELRRIPLRLPNPEGARQYLEALMANSWTWLAVPNNCVSFVEEVIRAGGGTWGSFSNCPTVATQDTISQRIERFLGQLQNEIYGLYGIPR